uniref:UDP-glucuronate 4-epimerase n=1 Tax=Chenopodium quinoa TaxID=63459 RepID=A0A803LZF9_CHEQI
MAFSPDLSKSTKLERYNSYLRRVNNTKLLAASSKLLFRVTLLVALLLVFFFTLNYPIGGGDSQNASIHTTSRFFSSGFYGTGAAWEKQVRQSSTPRRPNGFSILVTGAAVEADLNDTPMLNKLFDIVPFTHVLHLAAQAGVRYAMKNPQSYVQSNIAGFINLLEVAKAAVPQPAIVWASSSSVYGLNKDNPFSEMDRTDQPASLYAATKKAGEEIAHTYNHIYGLSLTGLRFFTVYGPWGRPDMAYFFFTKDILQGKPINIYKTHDGTEVARDFTYVDDIVKGCVGALDTAEKSTGSGGKKRGPAQLRVYNLGNTSPVGVGRLVSILEGLLNVKAKKHVITMPRNGDVPFTHANVTLARKDFAYKPTTDLATGLRKFVKWYVSYYGVQPKVKKDIPSEAE